MLVTGNTGFKGSWLCLWLTSLGADVAGIALDPASDPNHWDLLNLGYEDRRIDIRDEAAVRTILGAARPEIVFHLPRSRWCAGPTVSPPKPGPPT